MSSIRRMAAQAQPDREPQDGQEGASEDARRVTDPGGGEGQSSGRRTLNLPPVAPPEERKPFSTRVRPSLKKVLEEYTSEIRQAGFPVTQELVLDALLRQLRDDDRLREQVAGMLVNDAR